MSTALHEEGIRLVLKQSPWRHETKCKPHGGAALLGRSLGNDECLNNILHQSILLRVRYVSGSNIHGGCVALRWRFPGCPETPHSQRLTAAAAANTVNCTFPRCLRNKVNPSNWPARHFPQQTHTHTHHSLGCWSLMPAVSVRRAVRINHFQTTEETKDTKNVNTVKRIRGDHTTGRKVRESLGFLKSPGDLKIHFNEPPAAQISSD